MNIVSTTMIRTKQMRNRFENANDAYEYLHDHILQHGVPFGDTKALFNVGFYLENPTLRGIKNQNVNGVLITQKLNGNGIYLVILMYLSWVRYMVKYQLYGKIWLMKVVRLILIMASSGCVTHNLAT